MAKQSKCVRKKTKNERNKQTTVKCVRFRYTQVAVVSVLKSQAVDSSPGCALRKLRRRHRQSTLVASLCFTHGGR